ncbi:MAG: hypothetical protein CVV44_21895 [Spirochaetae bacterium HGW-Spirochaetae-1]|jgi:methyl-accepting chemotaxis protein|nr:MAG: hypothetical protein CVV44_21895 [Spirochaetae bacterium HGW-Spirochaetae-1]
MNFRKFFYGLKGTIFKYMSMAAIIPLVGSLLIIFFFARQSILEQTKQTMQNAVNNIKTMCEIQSDELDRRLLNEIDKAWTVAKNEFTRHRNIRFEKTFRRVTVTNQDTGETTAVDLPTMRSDAGAFYNNHNDVDAITDRIAVKGATSTIFQLYDNRLIRIATNVKKTDGSRAIDTYIPSESLVFRTISSGKAYRGRAMVVGKWTITHYEPIRNNKGTVIGALYAGVPAPKSAVFDMLQSTKIASRGYIYVLNSQHQAVWHPIFQGQNLKDQEDAVSGKKFIREIVEKKEGETTYYYRDSSGTVSEQIAFFTYYPKWDWIIVARAAYSDIMHTMDIIFFIILVVILGGIPSLLFVSNFIAGRITGRLRQVIDVAAQVSQGDLSLFIPQTHYIKCKDAKHCTRKECPAFDSPNRACWDIEGTLCNEGAPVNPGDKCAYCPDCTVYKNAMRSEIDELIGSINVMIVRSKEAFTNIRDMTYDLYQNAEDLAQASRSLETESQNQAASLEETTSANEELMATIDSVANAASKQADRVSMTTAAMEELTAATKTVAEYSSNVSRETKTTVENARNTEKMLQETTLSIAQISKSSERIVDIVGMINDISDQINLLSLNAAIEAARAGEHGKGFAVVSQEISKLADATAQSTKEIEEVIRKTRADVANGARLVTQTATAITDMIHKIEIAAKLIEEIAVSASEQISGSEQIMIDVEDINQMSEQIAGATGEQKITSSEILKAISRVNESVQTVAGSAQVVAESAETLKDKSDKMKTIANKFKVEKSK